jgi:hypothetical protein
MGSGERRLRFGWGGEEDNSREIVDLKIARRKKQRKTCTLPSDPAKFGANGLTEERMGLVKLNGEEPGLNYWAGFLESEARQSLQMPPTSVRETVTLMSQSREIWSLSCS